MLIFGRILIKQIQYKEHENNYPEFYNCTSSF